MPPEDSPFVKVQTNLLDEKGNPVETTAGKLAQGMSDENLIEHIFADDSFAPGFTAELHRRVSERTVKSTAQLKTSIDDFNRESSEYSRRMFALTVAIAVLTVALFLQGVVGCWRVVNATAQDGSGERVNDVDGIGDEHDEHAAWPR